MNETKLMELLEAEKKIVRVVCHNYLQQPMYGEKLQDTVIFHLENFTNNIISSLSDSERI